MEFINNYFAGGIFGVYIIIFTLIAFYHAALYKVYEKAGYPGWNALVPFYNVVPFIKIAHRPKWWLYVYIGSTILVISIILLQYWWLYIFLIIPFIFGILLCIDFAKAFDHHELFGIGLFFFPFIFIPIIAYSEDQPVKFREKDFEE